MFAGLIIITASVLLLCAGYFFYLFLGILGDVLPEAGENIEGFIEFIKNLFGGLI